MKVIKDLQMEIKGTNTHHFMLDEFSDDSTTDVLLYGYNNLCNYNIFNSVKNYKRKIYLNVSMPTEYCGKVDTLQDQHFDEIYGICPYTVKWLNHITKTNKYKSICYPFNKADIPTDNIKEYDVCYHGGLHGNMYVECLKIMSKFNYRYMSLTHGINQLTAQHLNYATNTNLSNKEKIDLIGKCKISIVYNTFPVRNSNDSTNIKNRSDWENNIAFKHIDDLKIIPQFKSRVNEAAMSKTLNLVKKDPWNVIENYYTPDKDFIYFESNDELEDKINEILNNWEDYAGIVENAYNKAMNYTTENLYNTIKNNKI